MIEVESKVSVKNPEEIRKKAKKLGYVIVVLAHDDHNKRPYAVSADMRKKSMKKLDIVNKIVVGDRKSFVKVVKKYKPNIIVLGYDQKIPDKITEDYIRQRKIKIMRFKKHGKHSTSRLHG